jgi:cell division protein FtsL
MSELAAKVLPKINGFTLVRPRLLPHLFFIALLLLVSLFFVWSRLQLLHLEYEISSQESRLLKLQQETRALRLEVATLNSPARIEQIARRELGLRPPTPEQVVIIR